jgi:hypothetical protein
MARIGRVRSIFKDAEEIISMSSQTPGMNKENLTTKTKTTTTKKDLLPKTLNKIISARRKMMPSRYVQFREQCRF